MNTEDDRLVDVPATEGVKRNVFVVDNTLIFFLSSRDT
jgi:hypothetical protein